MALTFILPQDHNLLLFKNLLIRKPITLIDIDIKYFISLRTRNDMAYSINGQVHIGQPVMLSFHYLQNIESITLSRISSFSYELWMTNWTLPVLKFFVIPLISRASNLLKYNSVNILFGLYK